MTAFKDSELARDRSVASPLDALQDGDCLILARAGNRDAQAVLVARHMPIVFRLCLRLLEDRDRASDATQEVFVRALSAMHRVQPDGSFRSLLCAIAWNLVRDQSRRERTRRGFLRRAGCRNTVYDPQDRSQRSPPELLEHRERAEAVAQALDRLDGEARAIVLLRDVEGLSYAELAQSLGCGLGTVKSRVHRARAQLKQALVALRPDWFACGRLI